MTNEQKLALRHMRDDAEDTEDKKILRVAIDYIYTLERSCAEARTMARAIIAMSSRKGEE